MAWQDETAVLVMGDIHYGKLTPTFTPAVVAQRLDKLAHGLERIRCLLTSGDSAYHFDKLVLVNVGDCVEGSGIYPTQEHHLAVSNVEQQANELAQLMRSFTLEIRKTWGQVEHVVVPGNHGRQGRFAHESSNFDVVYYNYLRYLLAPDNVGVVANELSDPFFQKMQLRGHNYLLYHGADIRMWGGIPWYGIQRRTLSWLATKLAPIDVLLMGHFHVMWMWQISNLRLLTTGTMVSDDEWSRRNLGMEPSTAWWLFGVSDKRPITWNFALDLA